MCSNFCNYAIFMYIVAEISTTEDLAFVVAKLARNENKFRQQSLSFKAVLI